MSIKGRIYLIGMPGSGKSYFGKILAGHFECPFIDLDEAIEHIAGATIPEIFARQGEDYFRILESKTLHQVTDSHQNAIISTGGGTPCFHEGIDFMNKNGLTVFLETDKSLLIERLSQDQDRPLMQGSIEQKVNNLLSQRLKFYQKARITISHRDPDLLVNEISSFRN